MGIGGKDEQAKGQTVVKFQIPSTKFQINSIQKYLKFPPPHPLPGGERERVRGALGLIWDLLFGNWDLE